MKLEIRIRPQRVAALVPERASRTIMLSVFEVLSQLWGGRYAHIIPIFEDEDNPLTKNWLRQARPEIVLGFGVEFTSANSILDDACQPLARLKISKQQAEDFQRVNSHSMELVTADRAAQKILDELNTRPESVNSNITLWDSPPTSALRPFVAASYGVHYPKETEVSSKLLRSEARSSRGFSTSDYIESCSDMKNRISWLDVASYQLSRVLLSDVLASAPMIVVVDRPALDFALFWNLRHGAGLGSTHRYIAVPSSVIEDKAALDALSDWVAGIPLRTNGAFVTSISSNQSKLRSLQRRLSARLRGKREIKIQVYDVKHSIPKVVAYDHKKIYDINIEENHFSGRFPSPIYVSGQEHQYWAVDLIKDLNSNRAPFELRLPFRKSALDILNCPRPPYFRFGGIPHFSISHDSISIRTTGSGFLPHYTFPSPEEVLSCVVESSGIVTKKDEKRLLYTPCIDLFGNLHEAKLSFTGDRLKILRAIQYRPGLISDIQRRARMGKDNGEAPKPPDIYTRRLSPVVKKIVEQRYQEYSSGRLNSGERISSTLKKWATRKVVLRTLYLDHCPYCNTQCWVKEVEMSSKQLCPNCHQSFEYPNFLKIRIRAEPPLESSDWRRIDPCCPYRTVPQGANHEFLFLASRI